MTQYLCNYVCFRREVSAIYAVGIRKLKAHLSAYINYASQGKEVIVTDRGKEVALLAPITPERSALLGLVAEGTATWSGGKPAGLNSGAIAGVPLADTVLAERRCYCMPTPAVWDAVRECVQQAAMVATCRIALTEIVSALTDGSIISRLSLRSLICWRKRCGLTGENIVALEFDEQLAADLVQRHGLRGYDAVHLASALRLATREQVSMLFSSFDRLLLQAASAEGLTLHEAVGILR